MGYIDFVGGENYIALNRVLLRNLGVVEAVLYCELVDRFKYYRREGKLDDEGMFFCTVENIDRITGIGRNQQQAAIKKLEKFGLIKTHKKGIPAKRYIQIIQDDMILAPFFEANNCSDSECIKSSEKYEDMNIIEKRSQKCLDIQFAENQLTSSLKISEQDSLKSADKFAENQLQTTYINKRKNRTNNNTPSGGAEPLSGCCCVDANFQEVNTIRATTTNSDELKQEQATSGSKIPHNKIKEILGKYEINFLKSEVLNALSEYSEAELHKIGRFLKEKKKDGTVQNPAGILVSNPSKICAAILSDQLYASHKQNTDKKTRISEGELFVSREEREYLERQRQLLGV